jgi:hypothetical protein
LGCERKKEKKLNSRNLVGGPQEVERIPEIRGFPLATLRYVNLCDWAPTSYDYKILEVFQNSSEDFLERLEGFPG